jgi:hypothetical protein
MARGILFIAICYCITQHKSTLFEEGGFSDNAIYGVLCYYAKVFGKLCLKACAENTTHYFIKQQLLG